MVERFSDVQTVFHVEVDETAVFGAIPPTVIIASHNRRVQQAAPQAWTRLPGETASMAGLNLVKVCLWICEYVHVYIYSSINNH